MNSQSLDLLFSPKLVDGYTDGAGAVLNRLPAASSMNIFIGGNNSGKSRLLRHIWKDWDGAVDSEQHRAQLNSINLSVHSIKESLGGSSNPVSKALSTALGRVKTSNVLTGPLAPKIQFIRALAEGRVPHPKGSGHSALTPRQRTDIEGHVANLLKHGNTTPPTIIYIPILRGLRPLAGEVDCYSARTTRDYGAPAQGHRRSFTGLTLFESLRELLLGDQAERLLARKYEDFLGRSIFGQSVSLIPKYKEGNDVVHVKLGTNAERPIHSLGDGIQAIITLTYPAYTTSGEKWILVEEPELNLHPGMQRKLVRAFQDLSDTRLFLTTHSNHVVDTSTENQRPSIYTFTSLATEQPGGSRGHKVRRVPQIEPELLDELGVRPSSVLFANSTIWVEGFSDRWFIREGLAKLSAETGDGTFGIEEGTHFAFVEYGGSNITHYSWLDREDAPIDPGAVCAPAIVVADSDNATGEKAARLDKLASALGGRFFKAPAKEIENMIPPAVLARTVKKLAHLKDTPAIEAWDDYKDEPIGVFLDAAVEGNERIDGKGWASFASQSGSVKRKADFWRQVIVHLSDVALSTYPEPVRSFFQDIYERVVSDNFEGQ